MIRSMTGFGKAVAETEGKKITVEIRSLNSKQLDIQAKMPWIYRGKEIELRNLAGKMLDRGKIDLNINIDITGDQDVPSINKAAVKSYYDQLSDIAGELYIDSPEQLLSIIMRLPETLRQEREKLGDDEWKVLQGAATEALGQVQEYRINEGKALDSDIREKIASILAHLNEVEPFEKDRIKNVREKIKDHFASSQVSDMDKNRFEQELIYWLEKLDINEEKVRLAEHCNYFSQVMDAEGSNGKKLGFIAQEMGREINTLGSKSNHAGIQKIVVLMKDDLEKIKEQLFNIL